MLTGHRGGPLLRSNYDPPPRSHRRRYPDFDTRLRQATPNFETRFRRPYKATPRSILLSKLHKINELTRDVSDYRRKRSIAFHTDEESVPFYKITEVDEEDGGDDDEIVGGEFLKPLHFKQMIPHNPLFYLLNTPIRILSHLDNLKNQIRPVVSSIPLVLQNSKRYLVDFGKQFHSHILDFASNLVGDFDHTPHFRPLRPLVPRRRYRRSAFSQFLKDTMVVNNKSEDDSFERVYTLEHDPLIYLDRSKRFIVKMVDGEEVEELLEGDVPIVDAARKVAPRKPNRTKSFVLKFFGQKEVKELLKEKFREDAFLAKLMAPQTTERPKQGIEFNHSTHLIFETVYEKKSGVLLSEKMKEHSAITKEVEEVVPKLQNNRSKSFILKMVDGKRNEKFPKEIFEEDAMLTKEAKQNKHNCSKRFFLKMVDEQEDEEFSKEKLKKDTTSMEIADNLVLEVGNKLSRSKRFILKKVDEREDEEFSKEKLKEDTASIEIPENVVLKVGSNLNRSKRFIVKMINDEEDEGFSNEKWNANTGPIEIAENVVSDVKTKLNRPKRFILKMLDEQENEESLEEKLGKRASVADRASKLRAKQRSKRFIHEIFDEDEEFLGEKLVEDAVIKLVVPAVAEKGKPKRREQSKAFFHKMLHKEEAEEILAKKSKEETPIFEATPLGAVAKNMHLKKPGSFVLKMVNNEEFYKKNLGEHVAAREVVPKTLNCSKGPILKMNGEEEAKEFFKEKLGEDTPVFEAAKFVAPVVEVMRKVYPVRAKRFILKVIDDEEAGKLSKKKFPIFNAAKLMYPDTHSRSKRYILKMVDEKEVEDFLKEKLGEDSPIVETPKKTTKRGKKLVVEPLTPKLIIDRKGKTFMELNGLKRPFLSNLLAKRKNRQQQDHDDITTKITNLIEQAKSSAQIVGSPDLSYDSSMYLQVVREKITQTLHDIENLINADFTKYVNLYENLRKLQDLKSVTVDQWKELLITNRIHEMDGKIRILNSFQQIQNNRAGILKAIISMLDERSFLASHLIKVLVRLQKLQCVVYNVVEDFSERLRTRTAFDVQREISYVEYLDSVDFVEANTKEEVEGYLRNERDAELEKRVRLLERLRELLEVEDVAKINEEARLLWEMKNIEKLQQDSIRELNVKIERGQKVRKELKILFDLQRQLESAERRQDEILKGGKEEVVGKAKQKHKRPLNIANRNKNKDVRITPLPRTSNLFSNMILKDKKPVRVVTNGYTVVGYLTKHK